MVAHEVRRMRKFMITWDWSPWIWKLGFVRPEGAYQSLFKWFLWLGPMSIYRWKSADR